MTYSAFDATGYISDVASNGGWTDFTEWARKQGGALESLANDGWTEDVEILLIQLEKGRPRTGSDESVRRSLLATAHKAKEIIIVSDGVGDESQAAKSVESEVELVVPEVLRWSPEGSAPMPPEGQSGLPASLEKDVPPEYRYWTRKGDEARYMRDALVDADLFNEGTIRKVNGEIHRVAVRFYLPENVEKADVAPAMPLSHDEAVAKIVPCSVLTVDDYSLEEGLELLPPGTAVHVKFGGVGKFNSSLPALRAKGAPWLAELKDSTVARMAMKREGSTFHIKSTQNRGSLFVASFDPVAPVMWVEKTMWTTAYVNNLADDAFLYVEDGGEKDETGRTAPRTLRHFPVRNADGKVDLPHLRNALSRIPQSALPLKVREKMQERAHQMLDEAKGDEYEEKADRDDVQKPYPNEHAARLRDPDNFIADTMRSKEIAPGIRLIMGKLTPDGAMTAQAYRFDRAKFTAAEAKAWLKEHVLKPTTFEEATEKGITVARLVKGSNAQDERYVLGIVLEPETVDSQQDIYSSEEIRQAAHKFMEEFRNTGLMHRANVNDRVRILESYIAPCDFDVNGQGVKKGTWLMAVRVNDDEMWDAVKSEKLTGFSIGGSAVRRAERD